MSYAELQVTTHFSFLRGAASAEELFTAAANLGIAALGIVDRNSVAGIVRCWEAAKATGVRLVAGCRLDLVTGESLLVWPEDRAAWSRLTRLLSASRPLVPQDGKWQGKAECRIGWDDVARWGEGLVAALVAQDADAACATALARTAAIFGDRAHLAIAYRRRPDDLVRIDALDRLARDAGVTPIATGDVLFASPDQRMLQDVVTAIRHRTTIDALGFARERNADRHMKSAGETARLFAHWPHMIAAGNAIVERCRFDLADIAYQYPSEATPGMDAQATLVQRVDAAARARFPDGVPPAYVTLLAHELGLIERLRYAPYFLTVNAIVAFARGKGILCQGRGSAANSVVCFLLGITSIDPVQHELLFERFISGERDEPPDIDVDFEHERREEVIQWIYATYGQQRAALTAVVSRYRARGAVREVGKALGLPEDLTAGLAGQVWGWSVEGVGDRHVENLNLDAADPRIALTLELARELIGTPRHLSQHPGGFVLTDDRLDDLVPIAPAAMDDRRVIEWDKDDIDALKFMKVDVLGLGMLGCMRRAFDLLDRHKGVRLDLASDVFQADCPETFAMIRRADTLGTFQIESRAQMSMLPRMKPKEFYDLVIQVAIVRPGPIQGDMVHPYLRRREGIETPEYPKPELEAVLKRTLGVPLFQEQAMKVAIVGAGFTPGEADQLRRAMATFKLTGGVSRFHDKLVGGMIAKGYTEEFASRTFRQIEGFGSYGFPESHAASFAKIAYASSWMKCHHPDIFCTALLNAQPMGFYAPAQIVRDAREHDVVIRPICIAASGWDAVLEGPDAKRLPIRLGLRMAMGLAAIDGAAIVAARRDGPFADIEDVWRRSGISTAALERLADADAFRCFGLDRRQAIWRVKGLGARQLPLFAATTLREQAREPDVTLVPMSAGREVVEDYRATQLSLRAHPLAFLRAMLTAKGIVAAADLASMRDGAKVEVAGIILVRQKPGSAKGVLFMTIEDETGIANGILWPDRFEAQRRLVLSAAMVGIVGKVQRDGAGGKGEVIHVIADHIVDYTHLLRSVGDMEFPNRPGPGDGATHGGSPDRGDKGWAPKIRSDYHRPFRDGADPEDVIPVKTRDFR